MFFILAPTSDVCHLQQINRIGHEYEAPWRISPCGFCFQILNDIIWTLDDLSTIFFWKGAMMQREVCGDESSECQHFRALCALSIPGYVSIMNSSHESVWLPAWDYDCSGSLINPYWLRSVWTSKDNSPWNPRPMGFEMKHWLFRILGLGFGVLKAIRFGESTLRHIQPLWNKPMIMGGIGSI